MWKSTEKNYRRSTRTNGSLRVADIKEKEREIKLPRLTLLKEEDCFRARKLSLTGMMKVMKWCIRTSTESRRSDRTCIKTTEKKTVPVTSSFINKFLSHLN